MLDAVREALRGQARVAQALDLCCGTGAGLRVLSPLAREVVGLDRSRGMLERARHVHGDAAGWVRGDALDLPFREAFDLIVTFGALGHFRPADQTRLFDGIWHALRPGGAFCLVTAPMPRWWSAQHLVSRTFNATMHVRNALVRPPFVMYYLTFLLPEVVSELERQGFAVSVRPLPGLPGGLTLVVAGR